MNGDSEDLQFEEGALSEEDLDFLNRMSEEQLDELADTTNSEDDWETDPDKKDQ